MLSVIHITLKYKYSIKILAGSSVGGEDGKPAHRTSFTVVDPFPYTICMVDMVANLQLIEFLFIIFEFVEADGAVASFELAAVCDGYDLFF